MKEILAIGLFIRIIFIYIGVFIDKYFDKLNYTDVDYHIFSDAAQLMWDGMSPYERSTYRYPPALAGLLMLNEFYLEAGKLAFVVADVGIVLLIYLLLENGGQSKWSSSMAWLWAVNPISINICTRGSADSITNSLVLLALYLNQSSRPMLSGLVYGLVVHLRIYPIIYFPAFLYHLWYRPNDKAGNIISFTIGTVLAGGVCTGLSYWLYGEDFLEHAVFYHLYRSDHRHNFSIHFYWIYLTANSSLSAILDTVLSVVSNVPMLNVGGLITQCRLNEALCSIALKFAMFLPQILLFGGIVLLYARNNLPLCLLLQTIIFVSYNKVITAQYFTWYLCLVPICVPSLLKVPIKYVLIGGALWAITLSLWLSFAYRLEFEGQTVFLEVWICSVLFHIANAAIVGLIVSFV